MHRKLLLTCALALAATIGMSLSSEATALSVPNIGATTPETFIVNYGQRAKPCADLSSPTFTTWITYASATVGNDWFVRSSNTKNCSLAGQTARRVIPAVPGNDGTPDNSQINMQSYALLVGAHGQAGHAPDLKIPRGIVPRGFRCFSLSSQWSESAWPIAQAIGAGVPNTPAFAQASGAAAGAGFCVSGARLNKATATFRGGTFFAWGPNPLNCVRAYRIKQMDDPNSPGDTIDVSPFDAQLWGTYDQVGCA
jgi:hypothetical protein